MCFSNPFVVVTYFDGEIARYRDKVVVRCLVYDRKQQFIKHLCFGACTIRCCIILRIRVIGKGRDDVLDARITS